MCYLLSFWLRLVQIPNEFSCFWILLLIATISLLFVKQKRFARCSSLRVCEKRECFSTFVCYCKLQSRVVLKVFIFIFTRRGNPLLQIDCFFYWFDFRFIWTENKLFCVFACEKWNVIFFYSLANMTSKTLCFNCKWKIHLFFIY